jgi:hypothetical protein
MTFAAPQALLVTLAVFVMAAPRTYGAAVLDTNGTTLLRLTTTNLNGSGIHVAQVEGSSDTNLLDFEINPADANVAQPAGKFTYLSANGTSTNYPNGVGSFSVHATQVASFFFGRTFGVATNISAVDNFDADYFVNNYIFVGAPPDPGASIVNQSFVFGPLSVADQQSADSAYDDSAAAYNTLYVNGAGNGGTVMAPATCYNGIGVGAFGGPSSTGPTIDNGRCKPDIVAVEGYTSFTAPQVAGAAAVLLQAGLRGDGGIDTNSAARMETLKALLLNGAVKPANWTNSISSPLDARYGAGILNVFNSYSQLKGGKRASVASVTVSSGDPHPPTSATNNIGALSGWDFASLSSSVPNDRVNHYYFMVTNGVSNALFTVTATLTWNRHQNASAINDLDLFLYDCANSNLVAQSISGVDNVEHIYAAIPPGRYDLQVLKYGGHAADGNISNPENYALAWEFFAMPLSINIATNTATISWPVYPDGFSLQTTTNVGAPGSWVKVTNAPVVVGTTKVISLPVGAQPCFFRLLRPAF